MLVGDDTVDGHTGKSVHGKARHRDPVRSSHSYTAWRYGHRWVVLAVLVRFPFATRPWALPVLVDLYRSAEDDRRRQRPHRTPARLMCRLLRLLLLRFPGRRFVFVGDAGYGSHEVARFCRRHHPRLTLVSKLHADANLVEPPPPYAGRAGRASRAAAGPSRARRPRRRGGGGGRRSPGTAAARAGWRSSRAAATGTGRAGLVPLCWVFVRDRGGTHRDEYLYSTDPGLLPEAVVGYYTCRWNIETTFQELRACLGLESTRGWCARTVLRGPVPVRAVHGRGAALPGAAGVEAVGACAGRASPG